MLNSNTDEQCLAYRFASLALPEDALDCGAWQWHGGEDWRRPFLTREWNVVGLWVTLEGEQNHHGTLRRWVHVGGEDQCTAADRWHLISALIDAGLLLESLQSDRAVERVPPTQHDSLDLHFEARSTPDQGSNP